jgi:hypothetical protein
MKIYHYDRTSGVYLGSSDADPSPLEPGQYLVPANSVAQEPPLPASGKQAVWNNGWSLQNIPAPPTPSPDPAPATNEERRSVAYTQESDPLFFKYQRGEATREEWLAKIEEIKARYPDPVQG